MYVTEKKIKILPQNVQKTENTTKCNFGHHGKKPFYSHDYIRLTKNLVRPTVWDLPHILDTKTSPYELVLKF